MSHTYTDTHTTHTHTHTHTHIHTHTPTNTHTVTLRRPRDKADDAHFQHVSFFLNIEHSLQTCSQNLAEQAVAIDTLFPLSCDRTCVQQNTHTPARITRTSAPPHAHLFPTPTHNTHNTRTLTHISPPTRAPVPHAHHSAEQAAAEAFGHGSSR